MQKLLGMATASCLFPVQTNLALKSNSPPCDSNKRLCKYWPSARNELLLEPTSVLDIRSPSPCSTYSSSFAGSCEGVQGSTENGQVVVSSVFSENASDGGLFPDSTSLVQTCDFSALKNANKNGGNTAHEEGGINVAPSLWTSNSEMEGYFSRTWKRECGRQGAANLVAVFGNEEGSAGGLSDIIQGNAAMMFHDSHLNAVQRQRELIDTSQNMSNSSRFGPNIQPFTFPSNVSVNADLAAAVQNTNGLNGEGKLKDVKKERTEALSVMEANGALEKQIIQPRAGDLLHALQCNNPSTAADLGRGLPVTHDGKVKGDHPLPRWEEWSLDLQVLPGNEFQLANAEKMPSFGIMEDLESALLQSPSQAPDQALMKWLLGECEAPMHAKGTLGGLPQLQEGGSGSGHHQLDLQEAMDTQFSSGTFYSGTCVAHPGFPVTDSSCLSMVAQQPSSAANFTPQTPPHPCSASFPCSFPSVPVSTMLMTATPCAPIDVNHLQNQQNPPGIDPSLFQCSPYGQEQPVVTPTDDGSLHFESSMLPRFTPGFPTTKVFPMEAKTEQSPMFDSSGILSNPYDVTPIQSISHGYSKVMDKLTFTNLPSHGNPSLQEASHVFSLSSTPFGRPQPKFGQQKHFRAPLDNELIQKPTSRIGKLQSIREAIIKSTDDPFPHVKQEFPHTSRKGEDDPISREGRNTQLPQFQLLSQCAERSKMGADNIHFTLLDQLMTAAEAVDLGNMRLAQAILARLNQRLSPQGQPLQRAAFYFKEALAKRVAGTAIPIPTHNDSSPVDTLVKISAFKSFCECSPLPQFAYFTANQAILEAIEKEDSIHLIDFDLNFGVQWASFLQEIALRPRGPPKLRITTVAASKSVETKLTQDLLYEFASSLNISLDIQVISVERLECLTAQMFKIQVGEAIVVNFSSTLNRLMAEFPSNLILTNFLQLVKSLSPKVLTVVDMESPCQGSSFFQQFLDSLQFYAFLFDSLESTSLSKENVLRIENFVFAPRIDNIMAARTRQNEKHPQWQSLLSGAGFSPLCISLVAETQAECLVQNRSYKVVKNEGTILLCWHGRALVSASAWSC